MNIGDARKRNGRCRNKICGCTGECFIDDGTGDFAPKNALGFKIPQRLTDLMIEDVLAMTDEEIIAEAVEEMGSIKAVHIEAVRIKEIITRAIKRAKSNDSKDGKPE